jgi:hypothetical protein
MRHAYYSVLQQDPEFVEEFHALYARLFPAFVRPLDPLERMAAIAEADGRGGTDDAAVRRFRERWPLPSEAFQEMWASFYRANQGTPLRLWALWRGDAYRDLPSDFGLYFLAESPAEIHARLARLGWKPLPPGYRDRAQLFRLARRLYMRAVWKQPYAAIAQAEAVRWGVHVTPTAVKSSVLEWAAKLGVQLPKMQSPGRPRKKSQA